MTDTTKTEALEWADLASLGSIFDHECAALEEFLRRIDASEAELKDSLLERALRIRTLEDERDRLAACLKKANDQAEDFERKFYLAQQWAEDLAAKCEELRADAWKKLIAETRDLIGKLVVDSRLSAVEAERDRLAAECEALRKDAERWREARQEARCSSIDGAAWVYLGECPWPFMSLPETADYADAAIDAAMGGRE